MKKTKFITTLLLLSLVFIACDSNDNSEIEEQLCDPTNNLVQMSKLIKSVERTNYGESVPSKKIAYEYNEFNLLVNKTTTIVGNVDEKNYVYDCSNNLIKMGGLDYEYDLENNLISCTSNSGSDVYNLSYDGNIITATGIIWELENGIIELEVNDNGLVKRLTRVLGSSRSENINYTLFEYDSDGNLLAARDYDNSSTLIYEYLLSYDGKINPFYGQLNSIYIDQFIKIFYVSAEFASNGITRLDNSWFPYLKNNIQLVSDTKEEDELLSKVTERIYTYDNEDYPTTVNHSNWGGPSVIITFEY